MKCLSIITINYNDVEGLRRTMQSVLSQHSSDYEWIVIDGGSSDGSKELIEANAEHIAYWVSEPDGGIYNAMNKGVRAAQGEYLQFLNSGDELCDADTVQQFVGSRPTADVIYGRAYIVDSQGKEMWAWPLPPSPLRLSYFWNHSLKHQASFFSRRCFERFEYNERHRINSDTELFMTLLYHNYSFVPYDRYVVRFNGEGLSSRPEVRERMEQEFDDTLRRLMPEGMRADYRDVITMRDVDIVCKAATLVSAPRWIRHIARAVLYPLAALARRLSK